jgi:hypothetical protein
MAPNKKGRTWSMELEVIGLRFRWKKDGRIAIARMCDKGDITGIRLEREPDNKYDENAIMVLLPTRILSGNNSAISTGKRPSFLRLARQRHARSRECQASAARP